MRKSLVGAAIFAWVGLVTVGILGAEEPSQAVENAPSTNSPPVAATPAPPEGEILVEAEFVSSSQTQKLTSSTGSWGLPVGTYNVKSFCLKKAAGGKTSVLKGSMVPAKFTRMDVTVAQPLEMKLGPPLTLSADADVRRNRANLSIWLTGREGETYSPALVAEDSANVFVKFNISDDGGRVLYTGGVECSADGTCGYTWKAPAEFKGRFKVEANADFGPFEVVQKEKWFTIDYTGPAEEPVEVKREAKPKEEAIPEPAEGETQAVAVFVSESGTKTLASTTGFWKLPLGASEVKSFLLKKMVGGRKYTMKGLSLPSKYSKIDISSDLPFEMKLGPPLILSKVVDITKRKVVISITLTGQNEETYLPGLMEGIRVEPPKFKIIDGQGKTLYGGRFELRTDGVCISSWTAPSKFKGGFKVVVEMDLRVFNVKQEDVFFAIE